MIEWWKFSGDQIFRKGGGIFQHAFGVILNLILYAIINI